MSAFRDQPFEDADERLDREIHGFDEREDNRHHSETDEHHAPRSTRKPAALLEAEDEAAA